MSRPRSATTGLPRRPGTDPGPRRCGGQSPDRASEPFQEALSGDLALEDQLLDRARYIKALAVAAQRPDIEKLVVPVDHCPHRDGGLADHRAGRALEALRGVRPAFDDVISRGAHAGVVAVKALAASRDDALASAERVTRQKGGQIAANRLRSTGEYSITCPFVVYSRLMTGLRSSAATRIPTRGWRSTVFWPH